MSILALGCAALAGCLIGFDEHKLRDPSAGGSGGAGGGSAADTPDGGTGVAGPPGSGTGNPGTSSPMCIDFTTYPAGSAIPQWVEGHGTWRIVDMGQGIALGQLSTPMYRHEKFVAWYGQSDLKDVAVRATIKASDGSDNCVVARLVDQDNFYLLCVREDNRGGGPSWDLTVVAAGNENRLAGNGLGSTSPHTVILQLQGTTLTPIVDGLPQPSVTDATFASGAAGVATESSGVFSNFCLTPM